MENAEVLVLAKKLYFNYDKSYSTYIMKKGGLQGEKVEFVDFWKHLKGMEIKYKRTIFIRTNKTLNTEYYFIYLYKNDEGWENRTLLYPENIKKYK